MTFHDIDICTYVIDILIHSSIVFYIADKIDLKQYIAVVSLLLHQSL